MAELREALKPLAADLAAARARVEATGAALQAAAAPNRPPAWCSARPKPRWAKPARPDSEAAARLAEARSSRRASDDALAGADAEIGETDSLIAAARQELETLPDPAAAASAQATARDRLAGLRAAAAEARQEHQRHVAEAAARRLRIAAIDDDTASWRDRAADAARHLEDLEMRRETVRAERAALASRPSALTEQRGALDGQIADAEGNRDRAAQALGDAEARLEESARALRAAEARLADEREERVRREAALAQEEQSLRAVAERVRERLDCTPESVLEAAGLDETVEIPMPPRSRRSSNVTSASAGPWGRST